MSKSFSKEEVQGKTVIDSSGKTMGKVKDVVFSLDGAVTLTVQDEGNGEAQLSLSKVLGISEYVIVRSDGATPPPGPATASGRGGVTGTSETTCKFCGHEMARGVTWCPGCGRAQA